MSASRVCQAGALRGSPEPGRQAHLWAPDLHSPKAVVNRKWLVRCPAWRERSPGSPSALGLGRELRVAGRREPASQVLQDVEGQTADQSDDGHFPQEGQRGDEVHVCGQTAQGWAPGCQPDRRAPPIPLTCFCSFRIVRDMLLSTTRKRKLWGGGTLPGVFDLESDSWRFFFLNLAERDAQIHGSASERLFAFISGTVTEAGARSEGGTRGWRPVLRKSMTLGAGGAGVRSPPGRRRVIPTVRWLSQERNDS